MISSSLHGLRLVALFALLASAWCSEAVAQFGEPKYLPGFAHVDYADPDAPKGGSLALSIALSTGGYDKFNPFSLKGRAAPGLLELVFETLTVTSLDEDNTQYGLLAEDIAVAPDFTSTTFRLRPQARFANGDAVTADDVAYSYATLTGKLASPRFKAYFAETGKLTVIDPLTVRFTFKRPGRDLSFVAGSLPVFSAKWGAAAGNTQVAFDAIRFEEPVASGPYTIARSDQNQGIVYRRNPQWWARDLPIRRGMYNFDEVEYKLYKDSDTQVAAMRAGDFDFFNETRMRYWCCQFIGHRFDDGTLRKELVPHHNRPAMNGWALNLRRPRFQDRRVREALNYAMDFEWMNQKIFDDGFERVTSYFSESPLAAESLPDAEELKLLEPYRAELDPAVFLPLFQQPNTHPPASLRDNLTRALELFAEAGWVNQDGALRNAAGEQFTIEVAIGRGQNPYMDPIYRNLGKLGILVKKTLTDPATARARMTKFDFDYTSVALRDSRTPAVELWRAFNSADADVEGSDNVTGVKSPAIDALLRKLLDASTSEEQRTVGRALDRVLITGNYIIPWRYLTDHHVIYNQRLRRPGRLPTQFAANDWVLATWWDSTAAGTAAR